MTVIVWDGVTLAADKQANYGGMRRTVTKIFKTDHGLVGCAGEISFGLSMVDWINSGMIKDQYPVHQKDKDDWQTVILVTNDKRILMFERTPHPIEYFDKFTAIGSGREYATASLHCGKSARESVEIACLFDTDCGCGIDEITL